jgi:hypothetical protein
MGGVFASGGQLVSEHVSLSGKMMGNYEDNCTRRNSGSFRLGFGRECRRGRS